MRTSMVLASLLLLLLLATRAQGIRPEREFHAAINKKETMSAKGDEPAVRRMHLCASEGPCSGRTRKLHVNTKTGTSKQRERSNDTTIDGIRRHHGTKGNQVGTNQKDLHAAPHVPKQPQTDPDILDIVGMDYSPAKRKPPIHN